MKESKKEREGDGQTDREEEEKKDQQKKKEGDGQTDREKRFSKKKKKEGDGQTNREEEEKKERRRSERRRSNCFTMPPLLRRRLFPFLLHFCFLFLQMRLFVFQPGIHLPTKTARFRRHTADTASIFSSTKQGGYLYLCTYRYGIFQPIRYEIDFLNIIPFQQ